MLTGSLFSNGRLKCFLRCQRDQERLDFSSRLSLGHDNEVLDVFLGKVRRDKTRPREVQATAGKSFEYLR